MATNDGSTASSRVTVGLSGALAHAGAAAADRSGLLGVCAQERLTRSRGAGFNASGLPDEAVDAVLSRTSTRPTISRYIVAGPALRSDARVAIEQIDQHLAHAATAYLTSPFTDATIVVCDRSDPRVSVWRGRDERLSSAG